MPIYEYRCQKCGRDFDLFVRTARQQSEPRCTHCGSTQVRKAVSLFGVSGSGGKNDAGATCGPGPV